MDLGGGRTHGINGLWNRLSSSRVSRRCYSQTHETSYGRRRYVIIYITISLSRIKLNLMCACLVQWYADRGIPFRRGYLLYGVPGSGKSSLIHAIAGELMLDIYVVSLSSSWINDSTLTTLMGRVPARCIVLLEDLDAAFTRSTSRDGDSTGNPEGKSNEKPAEQTSTTSSSTTRSRVRKNDQLSDVNTLTLSGLLNALDGVAASEGRLLFA